MILRNFSERLFFKTSLNIRTLVYSQIFIKSTAAAATKTLLEDIGKH